MQGQDTQKTNVISMFEKHTKDAQSTPSADAKGELEGESFDDVMKRNAKNKERQEKERNTANKSVLRSYRIKH